MFDRLITRAVIAAFMVVWFSHGVLAAPVSSRAPSPLVPEALPGDKNEADTSGFTRVPSPPPPIAEEDADADTEAQDTAVLQPEEISEDEATALLEELDTPAPAQIPQNETAPGPPQDEPGVIPQNTALAPLENYTIDEQDLVILGLQVNGKEKREAIEAYRHPHGYFLPLGALSQALDFLITVDPKTGEAEGWFMKEDNTFSLDMDAERVNSQGPGDTYIPSLVLRTDTDIFVDSQLLSQWLPLQFILHEQSLVLEVTSFDRLPKEQHEQRQRMWEGVEAKKNAQKKDIPEVEVPYQAYAPPVIDMNINDNMQRKREPLHIMGYSARVETEIDHLTTDVFFNGSTTTKGVDSLRARARREDETATLFGPFRARSFEVGDINPQSISLLGQSNPGRGFRISNRDFTRPTEFDSTDFVGDAMPGWDVELYWNGRLLDFTQVDESGRYEFMHVPIYYGNNNFKVVLYGPQGQIEEETRQFLVNESFLESGEFNYTFTADEKATRLFPIGGNGKRLLKGQEAFRSQGDFEYGLNRYMTSHYGYSTTPMDDGMRHNFVTTGMRANAGGVLSNLDLAYDTTDSEWASRLVFLSRVWDLDVKAEQKLYSRDFESEIENVASVAKRSSINSLSFVRSFNIEHLPSFSMGGGMDYETFYDGPNITTFRHNIAVQMFGIQVGNTTRWSDNDETGNSEQQQLGGTFSLRKIYNKILLRAAVDYTVKPQEQATALVLSAQKSLSSKVFNRISLRRGLEDSSDNKFKLADQITWDFDKYRLTGILEADEDAELFIGTTLSFSTAFQPKVQDWFTSSENLASQGAITARAFLDNDGNGEFTTGDDPLEGVEFISSGIAHKTNAKGTVLANGHGVGRPSVLELDTASLPDPNYYPVGLTKYQVHTRPGLVVHMDFPLAKTTEVDGTVYYSGEQSQRALEDAIVELLDDTGKRVQSVYSEFDGYYLFEHVPPGHYFVAISEDQLNRENLVANYHEITIKGDEDKVHTGLDMTVEKLDGNTPEFSY